ncbi:MAG: ABC transporter permease [Tunicatimonas sp.]
MLRNYLIIALRNLRKQRFYAGINVLGLSLGIASFLLILLYVVDELRYDRFYPQADHIFRVGSFDNTLGESNRMALTSNAVASGIRREIPEAEAATRLYRAWETVHYQDKTFVEYDWQYVDSSFFSVFGYELLEGSPSTALRTPHTVVVTKSTAQKYFGNKSALGKTLLVGKAQTPFQVTGVMDDPPVHTHLDFSMLGSMLSTEDSLGEYWNYYALYTYVRLNEKANPTVFEDKLKILADKYVRPVLIQDNGLQLKDDQKTEEVFRFMLQPVTDIYLRSDWIYDNSPSASIESLYILLAVALFILLLACINFMNLSTARSLSRAKEVGVRKTLGSQRGALMGQFLAESVLMSGIATALALLWVGLALYPFGALAGKELSFSTLLQPWLIATTMGCTVVVGGLAGSYPAFYLSSFRPVEVLRGGQSSLLKGQTIRNALVVFQFTMSIALAIATLLMNQQLTYVRSKQLGFDKENVLIVSNADYLEQGANSFLQTATSMAAVQQASASTSVFPGVSEVNYFRKHGGDQDYSLNIMGIDENFIATYGMTLREGRNFSLDYPADTARVILNETALRVFSLEEPIGSAITYFNEGEYIPYEVVGVVKDFNYESLHHPIEPMAFFFGDKVKSYVTMRLAPGNAPAAVQAVEKAWKAAAPGAPFEYSFLDEDYDKLFRAEQRLGKVFTVFTALAMIIACLGLLGLAAFSAERRTKEIGVRKVMGASSWSVVLLLSRNFTYLVLISFVIAAGLAYLAVSQWLESNFVYHITIGAGAFVVSGLAALLVAWLTVSYQSFRAARANPAKSLRSE